MSEKAPKNVVFIASAVTGFIEAICVQPFDMIKTRNHLYNVKPPGIITSFVSIYNEGGILRFYRGLLPEMSGMVPKTIAMYSSYELSRRYLANNYNYGNSSFWICGNAGLIAGYFEACTIQPFQIAKVRLQNKQLLYKYKNTFNCYRIILTEEGISSLFIGLGPTIWRNCVWNFIYFGLMHEIRNNLDNESSVVTSLAGFTGAIIATCVNTPFDVVKSRFQSHPESKLVHKLTLLSLYNIYINEGITGLYRGFQAKLIRNGIGGAVAMAVFDCSCKIYNYYIKDMNSINDSHVYM